MEQGNFRSGPPWESGTHTSRLCHYLWSDHKKRIRILAQFSAASLSIVEIMRCRLHGNKLSWRRTRFKSVAYISNLLGSDNVEYIILAEEMKEMLNTSLITVITKTLTQLTMHFLYNLKTFAKGILPCFIPYRVQMKG